MAMTPEERKAAKLASKKKWREKNKAVVVAKHKEYNDRTKDQRAAKARAKRDQKRAERGLPPYVRPTPEQIKERERKWARDFAAKIRREQGVPIRTAMPEDERIKRRRRQQAEARTRKPEHMKAIARKSATRSRLARQLGIAKEEVPSELFDLAVLINSIKYTVRKNK